MQAHPKPASVDDFTWYHSEGDDDPLAPTVRGVAIPKASTLIAESSESSMFFLLS
jgi:hypothetical protein